MPLETDCGSNEVHHGASKIAAKLTQKKKETFDAQTAQRLDEVSLLEQAKEEMEGRQVWHYLEGHTHGVETEAAEGNEMSGGVFRCRVGGQNGHHILQHSRNIRGQSRDVRVEQDFVDFFAGLRHAVSDHYDDLLLYTLYKRGGHIFRSHVSFCGAVWRDWVVINWGQDGKLPNKIWGFVDLTGLNVNSGISYGGLNNLQPGLYAIVESAMVDAEEADKGIFVPITTEVGELQDGYVTQLLYYLADVEAIVAPAVVVPDIGGNNNGYFWVKSALQWRESFEKWLDAPHEEDVISDWETTDEEMEEEEEEEEENEDNEGDEGGDEEEEEDEDDEEEEEDEGEEEEDADDEEDDDDE